MSEVPGRDSSGDIKWVVGGIGWNLSSCGRHRIEVITHDARGRRSLSGSEFIVRKRPRH